MHTKTAKRVHIPLHMHSKTAKRIEITLSEDETRKESEKAIESFISIRPFFLIAENALNSLDQNGLRSIDANLPLFEWADSNPNQLMDNAEKAFESYVDACNRAHALASKLLPQHVLGASFTSSERTKFLVGKGSKWMRKYIDTKNYCQPFLIMCLKKYPNKLN